MPGTPIPGSRDVDAGARERLPWPVRAGPAGLFGREVHRMPSMGGIASTQSATRRGVTRSLDLGGETLVFELVRSDRRTVGFVVERDGRVVVRAPRRAREGDVLRAVSRHGDWILRTRRRLADAELRRRLWYRDGEPHLHLGQRYPLAIVPAETEGVRLAGGRLCVAVRPDADPAGGDAEPAAASAQRVKQLLDEWYASEAARVLPERLEACWAAFPSNGHRRPAVRVKRMRTRWGSLSPKGTMSLRLDLVRAPVECVDYVVFHELCHLVHRNHGRSFWALVEQFVPDWRRRRRALEDLLG